MASSLNGKQGVVYDNLITIITKLVEKSIEKSATAAKKNIMNDMDKIIQEFIGNMKGQDLEEFITNVYTATKTGDPKKKTDSKKPTIKKKSEKLTDTDLFAKQYAEYQENKEKILSLKTGKFVKKPNKEKDTAKFGIIKYNGKKIPVVYDSVTENNNKIDTYKYLVNDETIGLEESNDEIEADEIEAEVENNSDTDEDEDVDES